MDMDEVLINAIDDGNFTEKDILEYFNKTGIVYDKPYVVEAIKDFDDKIGLERFWKTLKEVNGND